MSNCVKITKEVLDADSVLDLLWTLDSIFAEGLQQTVDLNEYSKKLSKYANFIAAKKDEEYIGLIAYYINEKDRFLFVPYVCVKTGFRKLGIADNLMEYLIQEADRKSFKILLEVRNNNVSAIRLYEKYGFIVMHKGLLKSSMTREHLDN